jgi:hypothetical protein
MERRKFLIGAGSLAAGAAAATGTGAFTSVSADRNMNASVAGDGRAYIQLSPGGKSPDGEDNGEYASISGGQLVLNFNRQTEGREGTSPRSDSYPNGLNQDSVNRFDDVFTIANRAPAGSDASDGVSVYITDKHDAVSFYWSEGDEQGAGPTGPAGPGNAKELYPSQGGANGESALSVGVEIDLSDYESLGEVFGAEDDFTIVAEALNNSS